MNTNSYLCRFLAEHPQQWENMLWKDYRIKIKIESTYAIFNYGFDCDFADPVVQEDGESFWIRKISRLSAGPSGNSAITMKTMPILSTGPMQRFRKRWTVLS